MFNLATPTFVGLPNSPVKSVDPYKPVDPNVQNELASKLTAFDTNIGDVLAKSLNMVKDIGKNLFNNGLTLPVARDRIKEALGGSRSSISTIGEGLESIILGDMTGVDQGTGYTRSANDQIDNIRMIMDGKERIFSNNGYNNVSGVIDFITDLTGNGVLKVFDLGAEAALIHGILSEVSAWGVPEIIDDVFGAKWNEEENRYDYQYDDTFRFSVVKRVSTDLSPNTDLKTVYQLILHGGEKALLAMNPSYPEQLLSSYTLPTGTIAGPIQPSVDTYKEQLDLLVKIMDILEPQWFWKTRKVYYATPSPEWRENKVWNLLYIARVSEDAKTLFLTDARYVDAVLTAPFYSVTSGVALMKEMYPYMAI